MKFWNFLIYDKNKYRLEKIPDFLYDNTYKSDEIIIIRITNI